ncbi:MAG: hypothetical protein PHW82_13060 [Bacteroidales bacterium]|nr:hypothetical protein [Bacteroidales bacterium]
MKKTPNRKYRLNSAKDWIKIYSGKNIIKDYLKRYSVNKLCAAKELRMIGVEISEEYETQLINSMVAPREQRLLFKQKREDELNASCEFESDKNFALIIGYTNGGFPYGVTHEEMEEIAIENEID